MANDTPRTPVSLSGGHVVGHVWSVAGQWYADPKGSPVQTIPCESKRDAMQTCERLHIFDATCASL